MISNSPLFILEFILEEANYYCNKMAKSTVLYNYHHVQVSPVYKIEVY